MTMVNHGPCHGDKYGNQKLIVYGGFLRFIALIMLGLLPYFTITSGVIWILGASLIIFGIGTGITITPLTSLIVGAFPQSQTGMVNGVYSMARNIMGSFGILLFAEVLLLPNVYLLRKYCTDLSKLAFSINYLHNCY